MKKHIVCMLLAALMFLAASCAMAEELTGRTAVEIVADMGIGWNLGNTFDATGGDPSDPMSQEQSWGNPIVDEALIKRVKDAGFTTIRIPVTWYRHTDENYVIDPAFMARVKQVVDYAYSQGMYVILNMHHEEWVNSPTLYKDYEAIGAQAAAMWKQIAETFADYDQHLIFEGFNEPRMAGTRLEWNGNAEGCAAVNYLNQMFVSAVRDNPLGRNGERCLMIPGYAASSSASIMNTVAIPTVNGEAAKNIIISVHCYSPYDFCLSDRMTDFDPGNRSHTSSIDAVFRDVQTLFLNHGIPVVIGETGATNTGNNLQARERWAYYMGKKAAEYGVPIIIWDNGNNQTSGGECHAWVRRSVSSKLRSQQTPYVIPTVIEQLMAGANSVAWGSGRTVSNVPASRIGAKVIWGSESGLTSTKQWDSSYIQMAADASWFVQGGKLGVVYTGSGSPKIILDSAELSQWWIPVDPDQIQASGGVSIAWFSYETMAAEWAKFGVKDPSQLRNLSIIAANGNITTYELGVLGAASRATFKCMGRTVANGTQAPVDPTFANMVFAGWYTTRDYLPGSEYTGYAADGVVYAKMILDLE